MKQENKKRKRNNSNDNDDDDDDDDDSNNGKDCDDIQHIHHKNERSTLTIYSIEKKMRKFKLLTSV